MAVRNAIFFSLLQALMIIAKQSVPTIPDGRLLQVFSSPLSEDDISAEYKHFTI